MQRLPGSRFVGNITREIFDTHLIKDILKGKVGCRPCRCCVDYFAFEVGQIAYALGAHKVKVSEGVCRDNPDVGTFVVDVCW